MLQCFFQTNRARHCYLIAFCSTLTCRLSMEHMHSLVNKPVVWAFIISECTMIMLSRQYHLETMTFVLLSTISSDFGEPHAVDVPILTSEIIQSMSWSQLLSSLSTQELIIGLYLDKTSATKTGKCKPFGHKTSTWWLKELIRSGWMGWITVHWSFE